MRTRALVVLGLCLGLAACSGYRQPPTAFHETLTQPYRLDSSDKLRIIVFGQDDLSNTYVVDQAGYISFPLVGSVAARGKTQQGLHPKFRPSCVRAISAIRTSRWRSIPIVRSSSWVKCKMQANIITLPA